MSTKNLYLQSCTRRCVFVAEPRDGSRTTEVFPVNYIQGRDLKKEKNLLDGSLERSNPEQTGRWVNKVEYL